MSVCFAGMAGTWSNKECSSSSHCSFPLYVDQIGGKFEKYFMFIIWEIVTSAYGSNFILRLHVRVI